MKEIKLFFSKWRLNFEWLVKVCYARLLRRTISRHRPIKTVLRRDDGSYNGLVCPLSMTRPLNCFQWSELPSLFLDKIISSSPLGPRLLLQVSPVNLVWYWEVAAATTGTTKNNWLIGYGRSCLAPAWTHKYCFTQVWPQKYLDCYAKLPSLHLDLVTRRVYLIQHFHELINRPDYIYPMMTGRS